MLERAQLVFANLCYFSTFEIGEGRSSVSGAFLSYKRKITTRLPFWTFPATTPTSNQIATEACWDHMHWHLLDSWGYYTVLTMFLCHYLNLFISSVVKCTIWTWYKVSLLNVCSTVAFHCTKLRLTRIRIYFGSMYSVHYYLEAFIARAFQSAC